MHTYIPGLGLSVWGCKFRMLRDEKFRNTKT